MDNMHFLTYAQTVNSDEMYNMGVSSKIKTND